MNRSSQATEHETDLATLLGTLASRLRNDGMALEGIAARNFTPRDREFRDYTELAASLDRISSTLEAVRGHLCQTCALIPVSESVIVGKKHRRK